MTLLVDNDSGVIKYAGTIFISPHYRASKQVSVFVTKEVSIFPVPSYHVVESFWISSWGKLS